jgi:hypothetical protein
MFLAGDGKDKEGNILEGKVEKAVFLGEKVECQILAGSQIVTTKIPITEEVEEGEKVFLRFDPESCLVLPSDTV